MKKKVLVLVIGAAVPALSQAQTSVTLFGIADVAVEYVDPDDGTGSDVRITNGVWSGSRLGLRGSEDLGGGVRGLFYLEHRMDPDTGTQNVATVRDDQITGQFWVNSYVGLAGGLGEIRLGRDYAMAFRVLQQGDMTNYAFYNWSVGLGGTTVRRSNAIQYMTPTFGGVKVWAMYSAGEAASDTRAGDYVTIAGLGNFGPVAMGLFYARTEGGAPVAPATRTRGSEWGGSLGIKMGRFGLGGSYVQVDPTTPGIEKTTGYYGSISVSLGVGTLYFTARKEDRDQTLAADGSVLGEATDTLGFGLSYAHPLSKRTVPYVSIGYNDNSVLAPDALTPTYVTNKPLNVALGLRHYF